MKVLKPFYYDDFCCIADQCIDSCCKEWTIELDKTTYNKYKKVNGTFGKKIQTNIKRSRKKNHDLFYGQICTDKHNNCPFLRNDNLCEIYSNLGESYLSNTCKYYPREIWKFGDIYEKNLYLSCPEVTKYFIQQRDGFYFNMFEENLSELDMTLASLQQYNSNSQLYNFLWEARNVCVEMIQSREIELWKRMVFLKIAANKIQDRINNHHYTDYENLFDKLKVEITNKKTIQSLDHIPQIIDMKIKFVRSVLQLRINNSINIKKFDNLIDEYNEMFDDEKNYTEMCEIILKKEKLFNTYIKPYEYIFENFIVYCLYRYIPQVMDTKDMIDVLNKITISYAIVRMFCLARWNKNHQQLEETDFIEILHLFGRIIEHYPLIFQLFSKTMKESNQDSLAYFTIFIR